MIDQILVTIYFVGVLSALYFMYKGYSENGHSDEVGNIIIGSLLWPIILSVCFVLAFTFTVYSLFERKGV